VLKQALRYSQVELTINCINEPREGNFFPGVLNLIDLGNIELSQLKLGAVQAMTGKAAYEYIEVATRLCLAKKAQVLVTTAINKESLQAAKVPYIGHTEIIGALTGTKNPLTLFQVHNLRVFFLSRHVSLRQACDLVTQENLAAFIDQSVIALKRLGVTNPRLAVAGLNPHSGEHGLFGRSSGPSRWHRCGGSHWCRQRFSFGIKRQIRCGFVAVSRSGPHCHQNGGL
jgi:4-hydroxythreonine-4-phosphate dehydrogenase